MEKSPRSFLFSVARGMQWIGAGVVAQGVVRVAVLAIMARLLSPREFGLFGMALIVMGFAERCGQLGIGAAFVQQADLSEDDLTTAHILSVGCGFGISLILCAVAQPISTFFSEPELALILAVLSLAFVFDGFAVVSDGLLQRSLRFREIVKVETSAHLLGVALVGVLLGCMGCGVWSLVGGHLVMRGSRAVLTVLAQPVKKHGKWSWARARPLLSTGAGFSLGKLLNLFSLQGDNFVVGRVLGAEMLGMYTRAYQAMTLPAMYIGQIFERVLFPAMAQKQDSPSALRRGLLVALEVSTVVALPTSVGMYLLSEEIVLVIFGEKWRPIVPVLSILSFGVFFRTAYKCSDVLIRSKGEVYNYAARQAGYTFVIVAGSLVGAFVYGVEGVAYAVVCGVVVNYVLMTKLACRLAEVPLRDLIIAHLPGAWVAVWIGVALGVVLPILRTPYHTPLFTLMVAGSLSILVGTVALISSALVARGTFTAEIIAQRSLPVQA